MIDTIVLTLTSCMYHINEPDKFRPSAARIGDGITAKQNPTKKELKAGIYKPHLTLSSRPNKFGTYEPMLKIELSLPKLMFGNNFNELQYKDFAIVNSRLVTVLATMGVQVTTKVLTNAPVAAIHYAKNILLTDGSTPYHYINKIKEANVQFSLDVNQTDYRNEGHSYKWHANSYEVVFYDKIRDLEKAKQSDKRALEKDNVLQVSLLKQFATRRKLEVLRMEVRLNKRQKMQQLFNKLTIKAPLTFKTLFKPAISKKVLLHYLDELERKRPALLDYKASNDKDMLAALIVCNPSMTPKQVIQLFGLKNILETVTLRELRGMLAERNMRSWQRMIKEAGLVELPNTPRHLKVLRDCLEMFQTVRSRDFKL